MDIVKTNNIISKISNNVISSVVSLYMYTLGSLLMGFSIYLMLHKNLKKLGRPPRQKSETN